MCGHGLTHVHAAKSESQVAVHGAWVLNIGKFKGHAAPQGALQLRAQSFQILRPSHRRGRSGGSGDNMRDCSAALWGRWNVKTGAAGSDGTLFALLGAATLRAGIALRGRACSRR